MGGSSQEELEPYKEFIAWYRNQFELSYPHGLGWELVKRAYLDGYAKGAEKALGLDPDFK